MIKRAVKNGFIPRYALMDSWFSSEALLYMQIPLSERYETLGGLFELIKDDIWEKTVAQKLWQLFDELLQIVIEAIAESGTVNIINFKKSPEYQYLKGLLVLISIYFH